LLFLESTMRLRTIFPKTAARRSKYWISADCLAPSLWPTASTNASTAFSRCARAPKLLGSLTAAAQASFATFAVDMISDAIILGPAAKASADYISSTAVSLCISATRSRSPSWDTEFTQCLRGVGLEPSDYFVVPRARRLQPLNKTRVIEPSITANRSNCRSVAGVSVSGGQQPRHLGRCPVATPCKEVRPPPPKWSPRGCRQRSAGVIVSGYRFRQAGR
jgi:hypothetical protein